MGEANRITKLYRPNGPTTIRRIGSDRQPSKPLGKLHRTRQALNARRLAKQVLSSFAPAACDAYGNRVSNGGERRTTSDLDSLSRCNCIPFDNAGINCYSLKQFK